MPPGLVDSLSYRIRICAAAVGRRLGQLWAIHCRLFDTDLRYRLVVVALADLLARRMEPAQLLRWIQRLIVRNLIDREPDF